MFKFHEVFCICYTCDRDDNAFLPTRTVETDSDCVPQKLKQVLSSTEMGDRLATIDMGRELGAVPLLGGELGPHVTQCGLGRGLPSYQVAS